MTEFWVRADLEEAAFRGDELRELGLVGDGRLAALGVFRRGEDLSAVECNACGDRHIEQVHVLFEPSGNKARLYIACKESGPVRVEPERVEVQRIDFDVLARTVSKVLGLGTPRAVVEGRVWLLGSRQFGHLMRDVFVARGTTWPDGLSLADHARLKASSCPVILVPNLLPDDSVWTGGERIVMSMSEFDWFGDDSDEVSRKITALVAGHDRRTTTVEALFSKGGGTWTLSFGGKAIHIQDMLGLGYVAELLRVPGVAIEAAALAGSRIGSTQLPQQRGIPMADETAINAVRATLAERQTEVACLQKKDWMRKGVLQEEISKLEIYLREVETYQGHARKIAGTAQRSRTSVTNAIGRAIAQISDQHPGLGRHLKKSIKTGMAPVYAPDNIPDWHF